MWEDTISSISGYSVASDPELGISGVLESINAALKKYVPKSGASNPHLKVSNLTRENLRKVITAFIATGEGDHSAPFYRQGTGTINMLVLALLSLIAEGKQNVIFAMEEPETAIPPYAQKRIVHEVRKLASQTIFTSTHHTSWRSSHSTRLWFFAETTKGRLANRRLRYLTASNRSGIAWISGHASARACSLVAS
jgi:putative ATP-dependent endonuclease of OLD family